MTTITPSHLLAPSRRLRPATGHWVVNEAHSHATFAAWVAGRTINGRLPLTGHVVVAESIEESTALLAAKAGEVDTGSAILDRVLAGPGFLEAAAFPEITFRSELLAWVPGGWRAVGRMMVKDTEHELACQLDLHGGGTPLDDQPLLEDQPPLDDDQPIDDRPPHVRISSRWVIDSRWITGQRIPAMSRRIPMTCSFLLERGT